MSSTKPAIVLVHGAYHRPAHLDEVALLIRQQGYEVEVPALPSVGAEKDPGDALSKDAATVAQTLRGLTEDGKDVVMSMHSYGGMAVATLCEEQKSATSASDHTRGRVVSLIFLSAYVLHKGDSFMHEHTVEKDPNAANFPTTISDTGMVTFGDPQTWYYSSTSREKADAAAAMLGDMPISSFTEPTRYGGIGWAQYGIPVHYIGCKKDATIPLFMQEDFVARMKEAGVQVTATWLDQDHSPFLEAPERVAELILGADHKTGGFTVEKLKADIEMEIAEDGHDTAYDRKSKVINKAMQDIGMGRYQWELFVLCGFGWMADNLWLQTPALTLPSLAQEFGVDENRVRYTTMCLFVGLCIGASFWGIASDIIGRRPAFNFTLFLAGTSGLAAAAPSTWVGVCALYACIGLGIGGNLPVDGALLLEFLPSAKAGLLTLLSVWWPVGQLLASLAAWAFIPRYGCPADYQSCNLTNGVQPCCSKSNNWGWRYLILTMGALTFTMFICRALVFHLFESPKFLLSRGRQYAAVEVVQSIAHRNGAKTWLTEDMLNQIGGHPNVVEDDKLGTLEIVRRSLSKFSTQRVRPHFDSRQKAVSTTLVWFIWTTIGMGYPLFNAFLPQYLSNAGGGHAQGTSTTYRNYAITSIVGVPGSIIAYFTVDVKYIGRKGTMAISTAITGIFLLCFTISADADFQLAFSSLEALFQNVAYGVLYAYTPEVFPAPNRGSGTGTASFLNRIAGLCAPIVAVNAGSANPSAPIYASGVLFFVAFVAMAYLPIETRCKPSL
ncbi:hypothetical protein LTR85_007663 [Meristemomyces frigidus]|nr:hypothetical protein LTR85_007663 [Meristemomyces frigidus]